MYAFNTLFGFTGAALFLPVSYRLFFPPTEEFNPALLNQAGYSPWALFAGGLMIFAIVVCVAGTYKEIPRLRKQATITKARFGARRPVIFHFSGTCSDQALRQEANAGWVCLVNHHQYQYTHRADTARC